MLILRILPILSLFLLTTYAVIVPGHLSLYPEEPDYSNIRFGSPYKIQWVGADYGNVRIYLILYDSGDYKFKLPIAEVSNSTSSYDWTPRVKSEGRKDLNTTASYRLLLFDDRDVPTYSAGFKISPGTEDEDEDVSSTSSSMKTTSSSKPTSTPSSSADLAILSTQTLTVSTPSTTPTSFSSNTTSDPTSPEFEDPYSHPTTVTPSQPHTPNPDSQPLHPGLSATTIAGIAAGLGGGLILLISGLIAFVILRKRAHSSERKPYTQDLQNYDNGNGFLGGRGKQELHAESTNTSIPSPMDFIVGDGRKDGFGVVRGNAGDGVNGNGNGNGIANGDRRGEELGVGNASGGGKLELDSTSTSSPEPVRMRGGGQELDGTLNPSPMVHPVQLRIGHTGWDERRSREIAELG